MKKTYEMKVLVYAEGEDEKDFDEKKLFAALRRTEENDCGEWFIGDSVHVRISKYVIEVNDVKNK